jgi:hypothetical protein
VAPNPTVYLIASDQNRNGKTLLARFLADYLLLDGRDPFLIDTDFPDGQLRTYFPGRTQLADFSNVQGQIKIFDTMLNSVGRDYIIDLTARHTEAFFEKLIDLDYTMELRSRGYRVVIFFIIDATLESAKTHRRLSRSIRADLHMPVRNLFVGSSLPDGERSFDLPALAEDVMKAISNRHFSIREFVLGDPQNLEPDMDMALKRFVYVVMQGLTDLEPAISLEKAKRG